MSIVNYIDLADKSKKIEEYNDYISAQIQNETERAEKNREYFKRIARNLPKIIPDTRSAEQKIADELYLERLALEQLKKITSLSDANNIVKYLRQSKALSGYVRFAALFNNKYRDIQLLDLNTFKKLWTRFKEDVDKINKIDTSDNDVKVVVDLLRTKFPDITKVDEIIDIPVSVRKEDFIKILEQLNGISDDSFAYDILNRYSENVNDLVNIYSFLVSNSAISPLFVKDATEGLEKVLKFLQRIYVNISPDYYNTKIIPLVRDNSLEVAEAEVSAPSSTTSTKPSSSTTPTTVAPSSSVPSSAAPPSYLDIDVNDGDDFPTMGAKLTNIRKFVEDVKDPKQIEKIDPKILNNLYKSIRKILDVPPTEAVNITGTNGMKYFIRPEGTVYRESNAARAVASPEKKRTLFEYVAQSLATADNSLKYRQTEKDLVKFNFNDIQISDTPETMMDEIRKIDSQLNSLSLQDIEENLSMKEAIRVYNAIRIAKEVPFKTYVEVILSGVKYLITGNANVITESGGINIGGLGRKNAIVKYIYDNIESAIQRLNDRINRPPVGTGYRLKKSVLVDFGNVKIVKNLLNKNRLSIKSRIGNNYSDWKTIPVSSTFSKIVCDIMRSNSYEDSDYNSMSEEEQKLLDRLIKIAKIKDESGNGLSKKFSMTDKERNQLLGEFNLLKSMVIAGNDSKDVIRKLRSVTIKLRENNYILPTDYIKVMELISYLV